MNIQFENYDAFTDRSIREVTDQGIRLEDGQFIDFARCAENFAAVHGGSGRCVAERDATDLSFHFYTAPVTVMLTFVSRGPLRELFTPGSPMERFHYLQRQIECAGYSTYDMS